MAIFLFTKENDFLVQASFLSMLEENDCNLIVGKIFRVQLSLKKVFGVLRFDLLCYMYIFLFYIELFLI